MGRRAQLTVGSIVWMESAASHGQGFERVQIDLTVAFEEFERQQRPVGAGAAASLVAGVFVAECQHLKNEY